MTSRIGHVALGKWETITSAAALPSLRRWNSLFRMRLLRTGVTTYFHPAGEFVERNAGARGAARGRNVLRLGMGGEPKPSKSIFGATALSPPTASCHLPVLVNHNAGAPPDISKPGLARVHNGPLIQVPN